MNKTVGVSDPPSQDLHEASTISLKEFQAILPIYMALAKQLDVTVPFPSSENGESGEPSTISSRPILGWLDSMDGQTPIPTLRHLLQSTALGSNEESIRALIHCYIRKTEKTTVDRDKLDFLLVQYFALSAPASTYHKQISLEDAARVMEPVLGKIRPEPVPWCEPFERMILAMRGFRGLREMLDTDFIEQGRKIKEQSGEAFYKPESLLAFTRFSFLVRRTLIALMHSELIAIRTGLAQLDAAGLSTIDCRLFGLSGQEPMEKIREVADEWKQPFQKEYTERSVNEMFEKLLQLRADVDAALNKNAGSVANISAKLAPVASATENVETISAAPQPESASSTAEAASAPASPPLDFDSCLEKIWEHLIAAPPARGKSITTVKIRGARISFSSWEVEAFLGEKGPFTEDLQRAVVARALVHATLEDAKKGNVSYIESSLSVARIEVSRLSERVDIAKQANDTEAAVNLGITRKRLLSALDDAEKI